ncbi:uncharacterized protein LOC121725840 [Aricia agestis]|uniref:uncharacterized protein LOC121725840 n=1 Tax=Aricia agestis TaxID=91739 RepID=UPI001C20B958|nr:uncharacterized protein LOC121725840 [Aricia agestis]
MSKSEEGILHSLENLLQKDYKGVNIAVYALATTGLAISIHKIRPFSKFSKATKVPDHFIKQHEPLKGVYTGVQHSPVRLLINHKAPVYLPLWHSSKPPLPVKLWGVDVMGGNAVNWLECVAKGKEVTLKPILRDKDDLVSSVLLHLPNAKSKTTETLDIGQKLVELGFAKASVPQVKKNTLESQLAPTILSAEARAKNYRNGIWAEALPPLPLYVVYWRKGSQVMKHVAILTAKSLLRLLVLLPRGIVVGTKSLIKIAKPTPKSIQTS